MTSNRHATRDRRRSRHSSWRRIATAFRLGLRECLRTPILLALVIVLPAYAVGAFATLAPETPATLSLPASGTVQTDLSAAFPAFSAPMVAALLGGLTGLFLVDDETEADGRLVAAGYRAREVVLGRLGVLLVVAAIGTAAAVGVALLFLTPEQPLWFVAATLLAALLYGTVGVVVGLSLNHLTGVYVVLFGVLADLFLLQNPLVEDGPAIAPALPGHFPVEAATEAAFGTSTPVASVGYGLVLLGALALLAIGAFYRSA